VDRVNGQYARLDVDHLITKNGKDVTGLPEVAFCRMRTAAGVVVRQSTVKVRVAPV
jgi:hypothetical protein